MKKRVKLFLLKNFLFLYLIFFINIGISIPLVLQPYYEVYSLATDSNFLHICENHDENTLFVFDVDDTLIRPVDAAIDNPYLNFFDWFKKFYPNLTPDDLSDFKKAFYIDSKRDLIEPSIVNILNKLLVSAKVVTLTAMLSGSIYGIDRLEDWRYNNLKKLGVNLSFECIDQELYDSPDYWPFSSIRSPIFYKGIIVTGGTLDKGEILFKALESIDLSPSRIVFVDDRRECLDSVKEACEEKDIPFVGFHYRGSFRKPLDFRIIGHQMKNLHDNRTWLSDEEVNDLYPLIHED